MPTSVEENKAQMRQTETFLNKSGGAATQTRSPNNSKFRPTKHDGEDPTSAPKTRKYEDEHLNAEAEAFHTSGSSKGTTEYDE